MQIRSNQPLSEMYDFLEGRTRRNLAAPPRDEAELTAAADRLPDGLFLPDMTQDRPRAQPNSSAAFSAKAWLFCLSPRSRGRFLPRWLRFLRVGGGLSGEIASWEMTG